MKHKHFLQILLVSVIITGNLILQQPILSQENFNGQIHHQKDIQTSAGPAPFVENKITQSSNTDAVIGTRAFTIKIDNDWGSGYILGKSFLDSCGATNIGPRSNQILGGLVFVEGTLYTWNQTEPFQLWRIDTVTGIRTLEFNMNGVPYSNLTGMTWDGTTMYGVATNLSISQIFTINIITGVCTPIGTPTTVCPGAISISGRLGVGCGLFSVDVISDNFYRWNKTTGAATLIGTLGVNANFAQDAQFDNSDGKLYWVSYVLPNINSLRLIDTSTGGSLQLCTYLWSTIGIAPYYPSFRNYNEVRSPLVNIPIDDFSLIKDSVLFPFQPSGNTVVNVNYRIINLTHTWDADLRMYAQHQNAGAMIVNRVGGSGDDFINTVLSDSGVIPIANGVAPFDGIFRPPSPLSVFNGLSPNGYWKLLVSDSAAGDTGMLREWSIQVTYQNLTGGINTVEIPNYYSLGQNYPNPFNPSTKIKFTLPQSENVKLVVFDILGKEVKTLVNGETEAGIHEVNFNASSLSSGVYFYRIVAGNFITTKKMLVIK
jgi:Secretion system C-terminal sorting domain